MNQVLFEKIIQDGLKNAEFIKAHPFIEISLITPKIIKDKKEIIDFKHYRINPIYKDAQNNSNSNYLKGFKIPTYYLFFVSQDSREILFKINSHEIMQLFNKMNLHKLFKINNRIYIEE